MSDYCNSSLEESPSSSNSKRRQCPACKKESLSVSHSTILQHLKKPWAKQAINLESYNYYFCHFVDCNVVYFSENDVTILTSAIRHLVGIKEAHNPEAPLCYCFDISYSDFKNNPKLKQYIIDLTRDGACSCDTKNPSGRCCLKDFSID